MSDTRDEINAGSQVTLHLALTLPDGTEAFSTFAEEPVEILLGDGTLREGMELALIGLHSGESQTLTLTPDQAYGWHDPEMIHQMPLGDFPADLTPEQGQIIGFQAPNGEEMAGAVLEISDDQVTVDFNHPMAGKELEYRVKIISVNNHPSGS
ncbi:MAG: FKBP-type peptidyl-prolyl cis-trans isomerase [bacterium]